MKKISKNKKENGIISSIFVGIMSACIMSLIITVIGTTVISRGTSGSERYGFISLLCWGLSSLAGCSIANILSKSKGITVCISTALGYLFILIGSNILFWDGQLMGIGKGIALSLGGMALTIFLFSSRKTKKRRKISYRPK